MTKRWNAATCCGPNAAVTLTLAAAAGSNAELLRIAGGTHTFNVAHGMTAAPATRRLNRYLARRRDVVVPRAADASDG